MLFRWIFVNFISFTRWKKKKKQNTPSFSHSNNAYTFYTKHFITNHPLLLHADENTFHISHSKFTVLFSVIVFFFRLCVSSFRSLGTLFFCFDNSLDCERRFQLNITSNSKRWISFQGKIFHFVWFGLVVYVCVCVSFRFYCPWSAKYVEHHFDWVLLCNL